MAFKQFVLSAVAFKQFVLSAVAFKQFVLPAVAFKQFVLPGAYNSSPCLDPQVKDNAIDTSLGRTFNVSALFASTWATAQGELGPGRGHTELARYLQTRSDVGLGTEALPDRSRTPPSRL